MVLIHMATESYCYVCEPSPPIVLFDKTCLEACGAWAERVGDTFVNKGEEVREYDL